MRERLRFLDSGMLLPMVLMVIMGTLTVYSAGRGTSQSGLWLKQSLWNALAFMVLAGVAAVNPMRSFRSALPLYLLGCLSLAAVLVAGHRIGGAQRWLVIGHMTWQPSELMKWITLLFVSFGLNAPRNGTVVVAFLVCSLAIGASIFLILEMDNPFTGTLKIPGEPMVSALAHMEP